MGQSTHKNIILFSLALAAGTAVSARAQLEYRDFSDATLDLRAVDAADLRVLQRRTNLAGHLPVVLPPQKRDLEAAHGEAPGQAPFSPPEHGTTAHGLGATPTDIKPLFNKADEDMVEKTANEVHQAEKSTLDFDSKVEPSLKDVMAKVHAEEHGNESDDEDEDEDDDEGSNEDEYEDNRDDVFARFFLDDEEEMIARDLEDELILSRDMDGDEIFSRGFDEGILSRDVDEEMSARDLEAELHARDFVQDDILSRDIMDDDFVSRDLEAESQARDFVDRGSAAISNVPREMHSLIKHTVRDLWHSATSESQGDGDLHSRSFESAVAYLSSHHLVTRGTNLIRTVAAIIARDIEDLNTRDLHERAPAPANEPELAAQARSLWYDLTEKRALINEQTTSGSLGARDLKDVGRHFLRDLTNVVQRDIRRAEHLEARNSDLFTREFVDLVDELD